MYFQYFQPVQHDSMSILRAHNPERIQSRCRFLTFGVRNFCHPITAGRVLLYPPDDTQQQSYSKHIRNIDISYLQQMKTIIFLDVDNQPSFFKKLGGSLPDKTFVWGFIGGGTRWTVPTHMENFLQMEEKGMFYLNERSGRTKDSADFTLVLTIGHLADKLPPGIAFTIISADKGFCEVERFMKNDIRKVTVVNPFLIKDLDNETLFTVLTKAIELSASKPSASHWSIPPHSQSNTKVDREQPSLAKKARTSDKSLQMRSDATKLVPVTVRVPDDSIPTPCGVLRKPSNAFRNIDLHYLQRMKNIVFLDIDSEPEFFQRIDRSLPQRTYVWGFIGGYDMWQAPTNHTTYQHMNMNGQWKLNMRSGLTKDSAHFAMVLNIGYLADKLSPGIDFTVVSRDKGFLEIERLMENDKRIVRVVDPRYISDKVLYNRLSGFNGA